MAWRIQKNGLDCFWGILLAVVKSEMLREVRCPIASISPEVQKLQIQLAIKIFLTCITLSKASNLRKPRVWLLQWSPYSASLDLMIIINKPLPYSLEADKFNMIERKISSTLFPIRVSSPLTLKRALLKKMTKPI